MSKISFSVAMPLYTKPILKPLHLYTLIFLRASSICKIASHTGGVYVMLVVYNYYGRQLLLLNLYVWAFSVLIKTLLLGGSKFVWYSVFHLDVLCGRWFAETCRHLFACWGELPNKYTVELSLNWEETGAGRSVKYLQVEEFNELTRTMYLFISRSGEILERQFSGCYFKMVLKSINRRIWIWSSYLIKCSSV